MKKSLALLAVALLMVSASGCGCCRGLFSSANSPLASPVYSQCAPSCGATCSAGPSCNAGASCGCESGNAVTYGYDGAVSNYDSTPMMFPTGSGAFGQ